MKTTNKKFAYYMVEVIDEPNNWCVMERRNDVYVMVVRVYNNKRLNRALEQISNDIVDTWRDEHCAWKKIDKTQADRLKFIWSL